MNGKYKQSSFLFNRDITGGKKPVYFNVLSRLSTELSTKKHPNFVLLAKNIFPGKKIDLQILFITMNGHHTGYENRLF